MTASLKSCKLVIFYYISGQPTKRNTRQMQVNQNQIYFAIFFSACVFFLYEGLNTIMEDYKENKYWRVLKFFFGIVLLSVAGLDFYEFLEAMKH